MQVVLHLVHSSRAVERIYAARGAATMLHMLLGIVCFQFDVYDV